jgi:hypothetical protein
MPEQFDKTLCAGAFWDWEFSLLGEFSEADFYYSAQRGESIPRYPVNQLSFDLLKFIVDVGDGRNVDFRMACLTSGFLCDILLKPC